MGKIVLRESGIWYAHYRTRTGKFMRVSTHCSDEEAAKLCLANLEREAMVTKEEVKQRKKTREKSRYVYFLQVQFQDGSQGPIKIGSSSVIASRLHQNQVSNHEKLILLGYTTGGTPVEKTLQKRFKAHWRRGEWYEPAPELVEEVQRIVNGGKVVIDWSVMQVRWPEKRRKRKYEIPRGKLRRPSAELAAEGVTE